jgi:hypothetical protein
MPQFAFGGGASTVITTLSSRDDRRRTFITTQRVAKRPFRHHPVCRSTGAPSVEGWAPSASALMTGRVVLWLATGVGV